MTERNPLSKTDYNLLDEETPYDDLTGSIFSAIHNLDFDTDGPETLEMIWRDFPHMEKEWQLIRMVLRTLTLEQTLELATIKKERP